MGEISFKENELYQEIELFVDGEKIGEAEVEIKGKMLSRLSIFPPYQDKGYGTQIVSMLNPYRSTPDGLRPIGISPQESERNATL